MQWKAHGGKAVRMSEKVGHYMMMIVVGHDPALTLFSQSVCRHSVRPLPSFCLARLNCNNTFAWALDSLLEAFIGSILWFEKRSDRIDDMVTSITLP